MALVDVKVPNLGDFRDVEIIEVQIGAYLGEDDIVRADDVYHRAPEETR